MYATVVRNSEAFPHNRNAWRVRVFDDGKELWDDVLYDDSFARGAPFEDQLVMRLGRYTAESKDVVRDGAGYRIENVRLRA